jgi:putative membrane protein
MLSAEFADPWRFEANPEVYLLVAFLIGAYVYSVRVLGPRAVSNGATVVTRSNIVAFVAAMALLISASTWPIHQISETYLYAAHMLQHMMLTYFMPPLVLLATPQWLLRVLVGNGGAYRVIRSLCRPVTAGLMFNAMVIATHVPTLVNASGDNELLHYSLHLGLVVASLSMWMPVLGPFPEWHLSDGAKPIYLFLQSVIPTVPAGWLTFAEGTVYKHYNTPVRVWGLDPATDQQAAGAIMKLGGSFFLWAMVVYYFFRKFAPTLDSEYSYRRAPLTFEQVSAEFERTEAPLEESPR